MTEVLSYTFAFGNISISLGNILVFVISVLIAFWAARTIRLVLHEELLNRMPLPRGVGNSIASLTYYSVLLLGLASRSRRPASRPASWPSCSAPSAWVSASACRTWSTTSSRA